MALNPGPEEVGTVWHHLAHDSRGYIRGVGGQGLLVVPWPPPGAKDTI